MKPDSLIWRRHLKTYKGENGQKRLNMAKEGEKGLEMAGLLKAVRSYETRKTK